MTCTHARIEMTHGMTRCVECNMTAQRARDNRLYWPANEPSHVWTYERIAKWFLEHFAGANQGCEGFEFCRQNTTTPSARATYGYVWAELHFDYDFFEAWLLDIRKHDGTEEHREFILVTSDFGVVRVVPSGHVVTFGDDSYQRSIDAIHWFADQIKEKA